MRKLIVAGIAASLVSFLPLAVSAQQAPQRRPAAPADPRTIEPRAEGGEIKLDEAAQLKAAAVEYQMQALVANFALLQRQYQDLLEERKKLLDEVGKKANVKVEDMTEWAFDKNGQRYVRVRRASKP